MNRLTPVYFIRHEHQRSDEVRELYLGKSQPKSWDFDGTVEVIGFGLRPVGQTVETCDTREEFEKRAESLCRSIYWLDPPWDGSR